MEAPRTDIENSRGQNESLQILTHIVVNMLILRDGAALVERTPGGFWKVPGGHVENGESPIAAVRREMREELGIGVTFPGSEALFPDDEVAQCMPTPFASFAHTVEKDGALQAKHVNFMYAYIVEPVGEPAPQEGQEIRWVGPDDVQELDNPYVRSLVGAALHSQIATDTRPAAS